jgi:hypothetical protein
MVNKTYFAAFCGKPRQDAEEKFPTHFKRNMKRNLAGSRWRVLLPASVLIIGVQTRGTSSCVLIMSSVWSYCQIYCTKDRTQKKRNVKHNIFWKQSSLCKCSRTFEMVASLFKCKFFRYKFGRTLLHPLASVCVTTLWFLSSTYKLLYSERVSLGGGGWWGFSFERW